ncbi:uncharacterized protein LOC118198155 [Stegodyphus dumicola]|uniref:uncharacterized protein LOC118198155 n=1 Tax=Stegodyphus dumicola TaxID=202533 RepID=UPI0015AF9DE6|nr:uncharacterized protein LOC118198155 [Stegodyphus dumicola]
MLGAECFSDQIHPRNSNLTLQNSVFGYIATGVQVGSNSGNTIQCGFMRVEEDLNSLIKTFWEIEGVTESLKIKNKEEVECEEHFVKTHQRDIEGRYVVTLPLRQDVHLGDSSQLATQRLNNLWKRLDKTPDMSRMYCEFMSEYEALGHMQKMQSVSETPKYIMPHHGVYKAESSTTKLGVVFDVSAPSSSGFSLNDCLMNGGIV